MPEPGKIIKKMCPFKEGYCARGFCALWTGVMCSFKGIGVVLEEALDESKKDKNDLGK